MTRERNVTVKRPIAAPRSAVWKVLADFPNIAEWNSGVKASRPTSPAASGVGAQRHCDLAPVGGLDETVLEWDEPARMVVSIDRATKVPIRSATVTFRLDAGGETTPTTLEYRYRPKGGALGGLLGPMLDRQLHKGFTGFLADLEAAALSSAPVDD